MTKTRELTDIFNECRKSCRVLRTKLNEVTESDLYKGDYIPSPLPELSKKQEKVKASFLSDIIDICSHDPAAKEYAARAVSFCYTKCAYNLKQGD